MEKQISRLALIELLIHDRDHHFHRANSVGSRFTYFIGGSLVPIFIALFISDDSFNRVKTVFGQIPSEYLILCIALLVIGYFMIYWGLSEHSALHNNQRVRLEKAIDALVSFNPADNTCDDLFITFWQEYGTQKLKYNLRKTLNKPTLLLAAEPDSRKWKTFHDRKIEAGIILVFIAFIVFAVVLFKLPAG